MIEQRRGYCHDLKKPMYFLKDAWCLAAKANRSLKHTLIKYFLTRKLWKLADISNEASKY